MKHAYGHITESQKLTYAGMYILKKLDLKPKDGGAEIRVMAPENGSIEDILDHLQLRGYIEVGRKNRYQLTQAGKDYIGALIDEAEHLIDEFDDEEVEDMLEELAARNMDVFRVRFLWGWYQGEFDDVVLFQQRRGFSEIEHAWQEFVTDDAFYQNLALELQTRPDD